MFDTPITTADLKTAILRHLTFTLGKDAPNASVYDWRMALSYAIRDRIVEPWFASTRRTWAEDRKRVYYLSMEFLIGRILEDATVNLGLREMAEAAMARVRAGFPRDRRGRAGCSPWATAGLAGWRPASWNRWRRWDARPTAMASAMSMGCSASASKAGSRSRRPKTG